MRSLVVPLGAVTLLLLAGCSGPASTASPTDEPAVTSAPTVNPASGVCDELGLGLSDGYNAFTGYRDGELDQAGYIELATKSAETIRAIDASGTALQSVIADIQGYVEDSGATADGAPFDPAADKFFDLQAAAADACEAAGAELVIHANGG